MELSFSYRNICFSHYRRAARRAVSSSITESLRVSVQPTLPSTADLVRMSEEAT
jgi:hypothetical protein